MATTFTSLIASVRVQLTETTATYWTDAEILAHLTAGARDLWRRINDLYEHHFITIDTTNVSLAANASQLSGVPSDVFRVVAVEPRVLGEANPNPGLVFKPADYNSPDFTKARAQTAVEGRNHVIWYTLMSAGAPVAAPIIRIAPAVSTAVLLQLVYNQTLPALTGSSDNPIPGESDNALIAWAIAYARTKEREDRSPDPEWLAVYATEKTGLLQGLAPRQIQEPEVVEAFFESLWD